MCHISSFLFSSFVLLILISFLCVVGRGSFSRSRSLGISSILLSGLTTVAVSVLTLVLLFFFLLSMSFRSTSHLDAGVVSVVVDKHIVFRPVRVVPGRHSVCLPALSRLRLRSLRRLLL